MRSTLTWGALALFGAVAAVGQSASAATVTYNSTNFANGFMNVFNLDNSYAFGSSWGIPDLKATVAGNLQTVLLQPNTSIDRDVPNDTPFWWQDGTGLSAGNKVMSANYYVADDTLAGSAVTFVGTVTSNTLAAGYTAVAFITDFDGGYNVVNSVTAPLTAGNFSITLTPNAGDHVQYGYTLTGRNARQASAAALTGVTVGALVSTPEPASLALLGIAGLASLRRRSRA